MTNQHWLFKTEPSVYSFAQLVRERTATWDGVANALALKHLAQVRKGDRIFIYHTGDEKAVVGVGTATGSAYPDPKQTDPKRLVVDVAAGAALPRPVTLAAIKQHPQLRTWELVRLPRLSVMPVTPEQWAEVERLAGLAR